MKENHRQLSEKFAVKGIRFRLIVRALAPALLCAGLLQAAAQVNVLTYHNDLARTGQNTNETILTPANVNTNSFGQLFAYPVDGQIYAQPLYVSGLAIPGKGTRNVVFVTTQHDSVYAFDADSNAGPGGGLLWQVSLGTSAATPNNEFANRYGPYHDIDPEVGITSTPVIDLATGTIYIDAFTHDGSTYNHRIHALNIINGAEQPHSPVLVAASVPGVGVDSVNGVVTFNPLQQLQRPGLTLAGGMLYAAYSSYADTDPYHGWVIGFRLSDLQPLTNYVFNTTPNATIAAYGGNAAEGGIWMGGDGLEVDAATNLFFLVANGTFNATNSGGTEYADSFVRLSTTNGLAVADYFTPYNQASLAAGDTDLGSGGGVLLPDSAGSAAHRHLIVGGGKEGTIYLVDRDNLGRFNSTDDSQIVQSLPSAVGSIFSTPAYFNGQIYYQGVSDVMKAFAITNGALSGSPISQSAVNIGFPGATPSVSAHGTNNAIVWVLQNDGAGSGGPAILHAYNAYNLAQEYYNSGEAGARDTLAGAVKTTVPTIASGKVYVGGRFDLSVLGTGSFLATPTISPAAGVFSNSVTVTLADTSPGAALYYTLDGSTPSTNSKPYGGSFVLTNTALVQVAAFKSGFVPSRVISATFINGGSLSLAPGFLKQEFYSGATRANLEDPTFSTPPNFINYLGSFETPSGQGTDYAERMSGYFVAPQTADYVFFVCSDDDSDLFLSTDSSPTNLHLIATETVWSNSREWVSSAGGSVVGDKRSDQFAGTAWPGGNTIHLNAGVSYYLEGVHHQGGGGDDFAATFTIAGAPDPVDGDAPELAGNLIATYAYNNTFIAVTAPPQSEVGVQGYTVTFSVGAVSGYLGDTSGNPGPAIVYQWQTAVAGSGAFTNIPNANSSSYTTAPLALANNGARFRVVLSTAGSTVTSAAATLSVVRDTSPPVPVQILSVNPAGTVVTLAFSKHLDSVSAQRALNYVFSPGHIVATAALLDASGTIVTISTPNALPQSTLITLAISGVQDIDGNPVPPNTAITFSFVNAGSGFAADILQDRPVAYWRFDEASGGTAYDSAGSNNAAYGSAAILGVAGPRPPAFTGFENTNTAFQAQNGVDQSWVTAPALNLNTNTVTMTAWLFPIGAQAGYTGICISRNGGDASGFNYTDNDQLGYTWNNNSSATWSFMSGLAVPHNVWSFVALVIQPTQAALYLSSSNGLLSATNAIAHQSEAFAGNCWIGDDSSSAGRAFNGLVDEVAVFNQAIPAVRLGAYFQAAVNGGVIVTNGPVTPGTLRFTSIEVASGQVILQWIGGGTLQEASSPTGPWTTLPNQNSPAVMQMSTSNNQFFRLHL